MSQKIPVDYLGSVTGQNWFTLALTLKNTGK